MIYQEDRRVLQSINRARDFQEEEEKSCEGAKRRICFSYGSSNTTDSVASGNSNAVLLYVEIDGPVKCLAFSLCQKYSASEEQMNGEAGMQCVYLGLVSSSFKVWGLLEGGIPATALPRRLARCHQNTSPRRNQRCRVN